MTIHPFHPRHDHHRSAMSWRMVIDATQSEQELVQAARDFLASFTPHEVELLPAECFPRKLVDGEDIAAYSYDLTLHRWDDDDAASAVIQSFARFFADASERLAQIKRNRSSERESA